MKKSRGLFLLVIVAILMASLVSGALFYYNPNSTITGGWNRGSGTTHSEIVDTARQSSTPSTGSFVASRMGDGDTSEFGFLNITQTDIENITLWVYTSTGNTAEYTFELRQSGTMRCDDLVPGNTGNSWRSCTWDSPTGDLSDLTIWLSTVERAAGGGPTNAVVYAVYLEVDTGNPPPVVELDSPTNNSVQTSTPISFEFIVTDEVYSSIDSCSLYTNFTGSWQSTATMNDVSNNTLSGFSQSPNDSVYIWSVMCNNTDKVSFADENRTITVNAVSPLIENQAFNETSIRQNRSVYFNVTITDNFGISSAKITVQYPNSTLQNITLDNNGDEHFTTITNTLDVGTYQVTLIWANDTLGQVGTNTTPDTSFEVLAIPPEEFDLLSPLNNIETTNLSPTLSWEETITPDFANYTVLVTKDSSFNSIDFSYNTQTLTNTTIQAISTLDEDSTYYWKVIAFDVFGNSRNSSSTFTYITDNTAPTATLISPLDDDFTTQITTSFIYSADDANTLDECILYTDSFGSWAPVNSTQSPSKNTQYTLSTNLDEGANVWNVQCFDLAGNSAFATSNRTVILDTTGPVVSLVSPVNDSLIDDTNIVTFTAQAFDELASLDSCGLYVNESLKETNNDVVDNIDFNITTFLVNDYYTWYVNCTDTNNNFDVSQTRTLTVESLDNDPPVISLLNPGQNEFLSSGDVLFNYSVSDATGVGWCALFVDDFLEQNDTSITNFAVNSFFVAGVSEDSHFWRVECQDNSSEENLGVSVTRNFTVDLTDPVVVLESPSNSFSSNSSSISYQYTPTDTYLSSCRLFTNESGSFESVQTNTTPTSSVTNTFSYSTSDGVHVWNVQCFDLSGRSSFAENNRTITVDTTPPKYENVTEMPSSPTVYNESAVYEFKINWTDNVELAIVLFENNFTSSMQNITPNQSTDIFSVQFNSLPAGTYSYKWFANDTLSNKNSTNNFTYVIEKAASVLNLTLNGESSNITINESQTIDIIVNLTKPSSGTVELLLDSTSLLIEETPIITNYTFDTPGVYNLTARFSENQNYTAITKSFNVTVRDVTPPEITLISPSDSSTTSTNVNFLYNVSDFNPITQCSLYLDNALNQTEESPLRNTTNSFSLTLQENIYEWRVECIDLEENTGVSETRTFEVQDLDVLYINISTENTTFESGTPIIINTSIQDGLGLPLSVGYQTSIIDVETDNSWWNSSWKKRKNIALNETSGEDIVQGVAQINLSNLNYISSCDEIRMISKENNKISEVPFAIGGSSGVEWCEVFFEVNISASEVNYNYYAYFNNTGAGANQNVLDLIESSNYYAGSSATDELDSGTLTNIGNIVGFNDDTLARLNIEGGAGTVSGHGTNFVNQIPGGEILSVEVRYRYHVTSALNLNWALRYSTNNGGAYNTATSGTTTTSKQTTSWVNITDDYDELTWSNINNTRLQARIVKTGGGPSATLDFFWVEMNVTYNKNVDVTQAEIGETETLIYFNNSTTNSLGKHSLTWDTKGVPLDNYSIISYSMPTGYSPAVNSTVIEIIPDTTPPKITLLAPENNVSLDKLPLNLSFEVFDYNLDSCTLYFGNDTLTANETISSITSGNYSFGEFLLDFDTYVWNVWCNDTFSNEAFAETNFTFKIRVPDPVINTSLEQDIFNISWELVPDADHYNLYITEDFASGFSETPNVSGITSNHYSDDVSAVENRYYKVTAVSNNKESDTGGLSGFNTKQFQEGYNLISFPFLFGNYDLETQTQEGITLDFSNDCLLSIWRYNSQTNSFERVDLVEGVFVPGTGSEDFTELDALKGYFFETNNSCSLKIGGLVPIDDINHSLSTGYNVVSWLSPLELELPSEYSAPVIVTSPVNSVQAINRFNSSNQNFEVTFSFSNEEDEVVWFAPFGYEHFTRLIPGEAYYFDSTTLSTWSHRPLD